MIGARTMTVSGVFSCAFVLLISLMASAPIHAAERTLTPEEQMSAALREGAQHLADDGFQAFANGDLLRARSDFLGVLKLMPDNPVALANLGALELREQDFAQSEKYLKHALRVQPEAAGVWLTLGELNYQLGKWDAAVAALTQAVLYDPKNPVAHQYLGIAISRKGWLIGAEQELRTAIELKPDYAEAQYNLALVYLQRKPPDIELAKVHYQRALELGAKRDLAVEKFLPASK